MLCTPDIGTLAGTPMPKENNERQLAKILLEAQELLSQMKSQEPLYRWYCTPVTASSTIQSPAQLAILSQFEQDHEQITFDEASGRTFLANHGMDMSKLDQPIPTFQPTLPSHGILLQGPAQIQGKPVHSIYDQRQQDFFDQLAKKHRNAADEQRRNWQEKHIVDMHEKLIKAVAIKSTLDSLDQPSPIPSFESKTEFEYGALMKQFVKDHVYSFDTYHSLSLLIVKLMSKKKIEQDLRQQRKWMLSILHYSSFIMNDDEMLSRPVVRSRQMQQKGDPRWLKKYTSRTKSYLEKMYLEYIENWLAQYPKEAKLGGRPTIVDKVKAYVQLKFSQVPPTGTSLPEKNPKFDELERVQGVAIWTQVYYLIRIGAKEKALDFIQRNSTLFYRLDENILIYFETFCRQESMSESLIQQIHLELSDMKRRIEGKNYRRDHPPDPFRMAIYQLMIGAKQSTLKFDLNEIFSHSIFIESMEDWMWYHQAILLSHLDSNTQLGESNPYIIFQNTIKDMGLNYFSVFTTSKKSDSYSTPTSRTSISELQTDMDSFYLYSQILLWSGMFQPFLDLIQQQSQSSKSLFQDKCFPLYFVFTLLYNGWLTADEYRNAWTWVLEQIKVEINYEKNRDNIAHTFYSILYLFLVYIPSSDPAISLEQIIDLLKDWTLKRREIAFAFGTMDSSGYYHGGELEIYNEWYYQLIKEQNKSSAPASDLRKVVALKVAKDLEFQYESQHWTGSLYSGTGASQFLQQDQIVSLLWDALTFYHMANQKLMVLKLLSKKWSLDIDTIFPLFPAFPTLHKISVSQINAEKSYIHAFSPKLQSQFMHGKKILEFYESSPDVVYSFGNIVQQASIDESNLTFWMTAMKQLFSLMDCFSLFFYHESIQGVPSGASAQQYHQDYEIILGKLGQYGLWPSPQEIVEEKWSIQEWIFHWNNQLTPLVTRHVKKIIRLYMHSLLAICQFLQKPSLHLNLPAKALAYKMESLKKASRWTVLVVSQAIAVLENSNLNTGAKLVMTDSHESSIGKSNGFVELLNDREFYEELSRIDALLDTSFI